MTRPRKQFVVGGLTTLPVAVVILQGGGVQVPTEAVWALALSACGLYLIWLGRMALWNAKSVTEILTLLKGENGLLARMDSAEHEAATVDDRITQSRHDTANRAQVAITNAEDALTSRIERLEERLMKGAQ